MGEEPWLNLTSACSFPEPTKMRKPRVDFRNLDSHVIAMPLSSYAGTYGNFAYGNLTVSVDADADRLVLHYGVLGHWILHPEEEPHHFVGEGQGHTWSMSLYNVAFSGINGGSAQYVELPSIDSRAPPLFERGLKAADAPDPPELECPQAPSSASYLSSAVWLSICVTVILFIS